MSEILCLSGKKQSGKNTAANFVLGLVMTKLGIVRGKWRIKPNGMLHVDDMFGNPEHEGYFDYYIDTPVMREFLAENLDDYIRLYSFADLLKFVCVEILGLSYEQVHGSDEDKNSLTDLKWENMPGITTQYIGGNLIDSKAETLDGGFELQDLGLAYHDSGNMTARQVMQFVGTEIFRKMDDKVWVNATMRQIQRDDPVLAVITDCRFPSEFNGTKANGGKVIRFTRSSNAADEHPSEKVLDPDVFDWKQFDAVIDNAEMSIDEQNKAVYDVLRQWKFVPEITMGDE